MILLTHKLSQLGRVCDGNLVSGHRPLCQLSILGVPAHTQTHPRRTAQLLCSRGMIPLPHELFLTPWNCQEPFHLDPGCDRSSTASLASDGKCNFMKTQNLLKVKTLQYVPDY